MSPRRLVLPLLVLAGLASAPAAAQARPLCADEDLRATTANTARVVAAVDCLVAGQRARHGLPPLTRDARLDRTALAHSLDMVLRSFFSHVNPDGLSPDDRARAEGYALGAGENIAFGYGSARALMDGWMASPGHCANVLSSAQDLGIGLAVTSGGTLYATQVLGRYGPTSPAAGACPVGMDAPVADAPAPEGTATTPAGTPTPPATSTTPAVARSWRLLDKAFRLGRAQRLRFSAPAGAPPRVHVDGRRVALRRVGAIRAGRATFVTRKLVVRRTTRLRVADATGATTLRLVG